MSFENPFLGLEREQPAPTAQYFPPTEGSNWVGWLLVGLTIVAMVPRLIEAFINS